MKTGENQIMKPGTNQPKKYGLLGESLSHSYSKIIHEKLGLYSYELFPTPKEQLSAFMARKDFAGLNVTIPYKTMVAKYCDIIDPEARDIGSINTLYYKNGLLHGANTDYYGLSYAAAQAGISFAGKKVLLLGGGGTSRTAQSLILHSGAASLTIAERNPKPREDFLDFGTGGEPSAGTQISTVSYGQLPYDAEIIVNTTPVGTFPNNLESLIQLADFPKCVGVLDVIYNPFSSVLVMDAKVRSIPCSGGLPMLVAQAIQSAELFTGSSDPQMETERIIAEMEMELRNIVLVGMPGSGKSSFGKKLAKKLGKCFVDLDSEVTKLAGKSIQQIFSEDGEPAFRALEAKVAMAFGKQTGQVIATGGGVLLNPQNALALKQNGFVVFIDRPVLALATADRPLSKSQFSLIEMESIRRPLYEKYRDVTVMNQGPFIQVLSNLFDLVK